MVFPNKDYITFSIDIKNPVSFTFPKKKPKKIWLDSGSNNAFRFKVNNDESGILIHMAPSTQKNFTLPSTVNSISISTSAENAFFLSILVEEWGN